jgi:S-adenosylmethionine hydrolase
LPETHIPVLTLTTDFGTADHYAAQLKGAIFSVASQIHVVDITHEVPAHDIVGAAFTIRDAAPTFPTRSVHVVVVDPGVGTDRRAIAVSAMEHYFVGPDNGVFSLLYEADPAYKVYHITAGHYMKENASPTFHGRDIFAPAAAHLARGVGIENFGAILDDPVKVDLPRPKVTSEGRVIATIIHVDRFGNLITNVTRGAMDALMKKTGKTGVKGAGGAASIAGLRKTYAEGDAGSPFLLFNSSNHLEVATLESRAADALNLKAGDTVEMDLI